MSGNHRALVAGAGIAGIAAAAGLHRLGWEVHLVDRRRTFDAIPTGLFFPANGMRAFAALGVAGPLLARGRVVERMRLRGAGCPAESIAVLAEVWPGVGPSVAIHRGLALEALRAWCPVEVRVGARARSLSQRDGHVEVVLSDGSAARYDLVVGADGAYSTVRGRLWPDAWARYGGESWWRGVVSCPDALEDWSACFCRAGTFLAMPIGGGLAYWTAGRYTAGSFHDPVPGRAARVREWFSDLTGVHAAVLGQVTGDAHVQFSPADQAWVDAPVRGRVVLVAGTVCRPPAAADRARPGNHRDAQRACRAAAGRPGWLRRPPVGRAEHSLLRRPGAATVTETPRLVPATSILALGHRWHLEDVRPCRVRRGSLRILRQVAGGAAARA
jgi:FAD-dependent urate hydroxylase